MTESALIESGIGGTGFFGITPLGLPITILGILFMVTIGIDWVPERINENEIEEDVGNINISETKTWKQILALGAFLIMILAIFF